MAIGVTTTPEKSKASGSIINDPQVRGIFYQVLTLVVLAAFVYWEADNTIENLKRANIASGYGFLKGRAGFDVGQSLIAYTSDSTYQRALFVGLFNTLLVAGCGIVTATVIGFTVGIGRLSHNWLIAKLSLTYVEVFRNIPPLLVIFFWYLGVLAILPQPRDAFHLPFGSLLSNRGLTIPVPVWGEGAWLLLGCKGKDRGKLSACYYGVETLDLTLPGLFELLAQSKARPKSLSMLITSPVGRWRVQLPSFSGTRRFLMRTLPKVPRIITS